MSLPTDRKYTESHEWVKAEGDVFVVGITDTAQDQLGDLVFVGDVKVGAKLNAMLEMGQSKPWPEALKTFTGSPQMSAKPMLDYFAPLKKWLDAQNKGETSGW